MERCYICGDTFDKVHKRQILYGDSDCLRERKKHNSADWKQRHPDYMRNYMDGYRKLPCGSGICTV
jgi:hypothetical protein